MAFLQFARQAADLAVIEVTPRGLVLKEVAVDTTLEAVSGLHFSFITL